MTVPGKSELKSVIQTIEALVLTRWQIAIRRIILIQREVPTCKGVESTFWRSSVRGRGPEEAMLGDPES